MREAVRVPMSTAPTTTVANCRVQHLRPTYVNLKAWLGNPEHVYIGRPGIVFIDGERFPKKGSPFANPFKGKDALDKFKVYFRRRVQTDPEFTRALLQLRGKRLGCWCHPAPCHGHVLAEWLDEHA